MNFPRTRQKIFVDAGAWIAHSNPSDQHHDTAVAMYTHLVQQRIPLLTTDYVVDEAITRLRYDATHARAVAFLDFMKDAVKRDAVTLERIDVDRFEEAEILFDDTAPHDYLLRIAPVLWCVRNMRSLRFSDSINIFRSSS